MRSTEILISGWLLFFLVSCGSASNSFNQEQVLRSAKDTPAHFDSPVSISGERVCKSLLTDPRDGTSTSISFIRSEFPMADYEVTNGKYGVESDELLRVNCETGEVVGIVRK